MANAINQLLANSELRQKYGSLALHRVRTKFTVDAMVRGTLDVYKQVGNVGLGTHYVTKRPGKARS